MVRVIRNDLLFLAGSEEFWDMAQRRSGNGIRIDFDRVVRYFHIGLDI